MPWNLDWGNEIKRLKEDMKVEIKVAHKIGPVDIREWRKLKAKRFSFTVDWGNTSIFSLGFYDYPHVNDSKFLHPQSWSLSKASTSYFQLFYIFTSIFNRHLKLNPFLKMILLVLTRDGIRNAHSEYGTSSKWVFN